MVRDINVFEASTVLAVSGALGGTAAILAPSETPLRCTVAGGLIGLGRRAATRIGSRMTVLSREELRAALQAMPPLVEDVDPVLQLQPNGVDLRVERVQRLTSPGLLGAADAVREPAAREEVEADKDGWWDLHRGAYVITYREKVNLPTDLMALSRPRSSLLRSGVAIHGAVWDAGYSGRGEGLLSVLNARGYRLQRGARVAQLVFFRLSSPTEGYRGRYHGENA